MLSLEFVITCGDCGSAVAESESGKPTEERVPCAQCGGTAHHTTVRANETVTLTDQLDVSLALAPTRPWQEKWHETAGCLAEIEDFYQRGAPGTENARRAVEAFFKACRELADWIEQSAGKRALAYVHSDPT
jgi:hypothetical protein